MIDHEETLQTKEDKNEEKNETGQWKSLKKSLTNAEIIAQAFLFLVAGSETTASTMTFVAYLLAKNPEIQNKLYNEIVKANDAHVNNFSFNNFSKMKFCNF
jgi:cytochrome P450 family 6